MLCPRWIAESGLKATIVLLVTFSTLGVAADTTGTLPRASMATLMMRDLESMPGKEVVMLTVTYPGGVASLPHRHDAQVFVYVLEGQVTMQVRGSAAETLRPGGTFYEAPQDIHVVSENSNKTLPAKILVVMIKDKGSAVSRMAE